MLAEKMADGTAGELAWDAGPAAQQLWRHAAGLLLHRHQWVRKVCPLAAASQEGWDVACCSELR